MNGALGGAVATALDAALAQVLGATGGQALRLVDGRSARVLGTAGWGRRDDVAALVRLAAHALPVAAPDGGLTDLVVTAGRTVHVLRPGPAASVLVLRLGAGDELDLARRVLAAPQTFGAVSAAMPLRSVPGPVRLPVQRGAHPVPVPRPRLSPLPADQPALSALSAPAVATGPASTGALAALALGGPVAVPAPTDAAPVVPLPRRPHGEPSALPRQVAAGDWAQDVAAMRRVLAGLRRLR